MHVALEMDGEAEIDAGGEEDHAAACGCRRFDGAVDGIGVEGFAVAGCAVVADVEDGRLRAAVFFAFRCGEGDSRKSRSGHAKAADTQKIAAHGTEVDSLRILLVFSLVS